MNDYIGINIGNCKKKKKSSPQNHFARTGETCMKTSSGSVNLSLFIQNKLKVVGPKWGGGVEF